MTAAPQSASSNPLSDLRLALLSNGYWPIPVRGKRPHISGWSSLRATPTSIAAWERGHQDHTNTGLLAGDVVAIDVDVLDPAISAKLGDIVRALPGGQGALCRVGQAPKAMYLFRASEPREKATTAAYIVNGAKAQVEVLGMGQQFVAFGIHPDTGAPYEWIGNCPLDVPLAELPEITPAAVDAFLAEAEAALAAAGVPEKKTAPKFSRSQAGDSFWNRVNTAALASPDRWVLHLFPSAKQEAGTGAWRVTSKDLGRSLQEDISIHPDGIQDFGREQPETPINLAQEYGGAPTAKDAAFWLCECLGVEPAALGWNVEPIGVRMNFGSTKEPPEAANDDYEDEDTADDFVIPAASKHGLPEGLCYPPGAVGEFARFIASCARFPSPHLSLVASLALTAGLIGRRYKGPTGLRSNLYVVGLAESGFGKDITLRVSAALADSTNAGDKVSQAMFVDDIRSLPGLAGRLRKSPSAVCTIDEFGKFLAAHTGRNVASYRQEIVAALMQLTGATAGFWGGMEKAVGNIPRIIQPCFSIHGVSTPSTFWNALSSGNISEGLLGRLVLIDAGGTEPKKVRRPVGNIEDVPAALSVVVEALLGASGSKFGGGPFYALNASSEARPFPIMTAEWVPGVDDLFEDFDDSIRARKSRIDPQYRPILNRVGENAARLALIVAVGCDPKNPVITREIQEWANTVAEHSFETILRGADANIADNERAAEYLRVRSMIARKAASGITARLIVKTLRGSIDRRRLEDILAMLRQSQEVHLAKHRTESGQYQIRYWAAECLPEGAEIAKFESG